MSEHKVERANVLGVGVHALDLASAAQVLSDTVTARKKGYVSVTGVHGVMEATRDPAFTSILNRSLLVVADGMPLVWIGKIQGRSGIARVYGPDLMLKVCEASVEKGQTHFLYGGNEGVVEELRAALVNRYPGIQIVGTYTPPFRPLTQREETQLQDIVSNCSPDFFWVGLSTPKQERFMARYLDELDTRVMIGVGAAFDIHTGRTKDAPSWIKNLGLQWAHRLMQEPRRLWKRYLMNNPVFLVLMGLQLLRLREFSLDQSHNS